MTFDSNGGTAPAGTDYSPKQVEKGKKKGYYSYWKKADGTGKYYANDYLVPDSDVTLVAQYDPIEYTIKYDPNLPDATGMAENQTYVYDTADFKLTEDTFTSTTKDFLSWSLTQDAVTASLSLGRGR